MTFNSKRTIASMAAGLLLITAYIIYALSKNSPEPENLKSWAIVMLVFIGIGVAALIVIQILFHIGMAIGVAVKEQKSSDKEVERIISATMVEDEREKLISLKSSHVSYIFVGIGFVSMLVALAFGIGSVFALHILFGSFTVGSLVEGSVNIYLNEKGVHNG